MRSDLYQQKTTISVPRDGFLNVVVYNEELSKKDLRVALFLMSELDGCREKVRNTLDDPLNFKRIDPSRIAIQLQMKKGDVKDCLTHLIEEGILETGNSHTVKNGYRFTF